MNGDLVSIIMPCHNSAEFISESIDSIIGQGYVNWELIIVDDFSSDYTPEIVKKYASEDSRIGAIYLDFKCGPAIARNIGISKARGRFIAFCDSDDIWYSNKLARQIEAFYSSGAAIVFTSYKRISDNGLEYGSAVTAPDLVGYQELLKYNPIGCSTAAYDTYICGKVYMPAIEKRQDYALWLILTRKSGAAVGIKETLVNYKIRPGSLSNNKLSAAWYHWLVLKKITGLPFVYRTFFYLHYIINSLSRLAADRAR
jgi:glycosyltransferase involved in cell wall biosynthesis